MHSYHEGDATSGGEMLRYYGCTGDIVKLPVFYFDPFSAHEYLFSVVSVDARASIDTCGWCYRKIPAGMRTCGVCLDTCYETYFYCNERRLRATYEILKQLNFQYFQFSLTLLGLRISILPSWDPFFLALVVP